MASLDEVPVAGESVVCFKYGLEGTLVEVIAHLPSSKTSTQPDNTPPGFAGRGGS